MRSILHAAGLAAAVVAPAQAESLLERGDYLMNTIVACGNCHTAMGPEGPGPELAGGLPFELPPFTTWAANITPDPETGIGDWSDAEIGRAIREGIGRDGQLLAPVMPAAFYRHISDRDLAALIAYLRQVEPVSNSLPETEFRMELPPAWVEPVESVAEPDRDDPLAYGAYLARIGHCLECHTPLDAEGHPQPERAGAGGMEFPGPWGVSVSANISSHPELGLGAWSDAEIKRAIAGGIGRDGRDLLPPMGFAYYAGMTEADLDALVAWLRTLPAVE